MRLESCRAPRPAWLLSTTANAPLPPVLLPMAPGSSNSQPPFVPGALVTDQPLGAAVESKPSGVPMSFTVERGVVPDHGWMGGAKSGLAPEPLRPTDAVAGWYPA